MIRRCIAFLLVLALGLPAGALAQAVHRCTVAGLALGSLPDCCRNRLADEARDSAARSDCCDVHVAPHTAGPAAPLAPASIQAPVPTAVVALTPPVQPTTVPRPLVLRPAGARAPPPLHGRGIYLEVCSFLI